ncbi:MAG: S8 family serine peptidase [Clostridiales bacterium]|nr:S8 family serine peptidase [Clostridiales bacterium]
MKAFKTALCLFLVLVLSLFALRPDAIEKSIVTLKREIAQSAERAKTTSPDLLKQVEDPTEINAIAEIKSMSVGKDGVTLSDTGENDFYREASPDEIVSLTDSDDIGFVPDEILVMFYPGVPFIKKLSLINEIGGTVTGYTAILNKYQIKLSEEKSFDDLCALADELTARDEVALASCNMAYKFYETAVPDDPWLDPGGTYDVTYGWNEDRPSGGNWWLEVTDTVSAWDNVKYCSDITVGVIDSGFETEHEDLAGKISFPSKRFERLNIPTSHGTHVAGIIAAKANNKKGITGICQTAKLLCVDWSPEKGQYWSTDERIFTAFVSLVTHGAKVINLSLGATSGFDPGNAFFWDIGVRFESAFYSFVIARLLDLGYDFLVVQSAGNGDKNDEICDSRYNGTFCGISQKTAFPGLGKAKKQDVLDRVVIAGSITQAHNGKHFYQSSFSNIGDGVSICAPGSSVYSCTTIENGSYTWLSGTSMAAPVVTGIAAMTWSANPSLSGADVKHIITDTANTKYDAIVYYNDGYDQYVYPVINADLSVKAALRLRGIDDETTETTSDDETTTDTLIDPKSLSPERSAEYDPDSVYNTISDMETVEKYRHEIGV